MATPVNSLRRRVVHVALTRVELAALSKPGEELRIEWDEGDDPPTAMVVGEVAPHYAARRPVNYYWEGTARSTSSDNPHLL